MNSILEIIVVGIAYSGMIVSGAALGTLLASGGDRKRQAIFLFCGLASLSGIVAVAMLAGGKL